MEQTRSLRWTVFVIVISLLLLSSSLVTATYYCSATANPQLNATDVSPGQFVGMFAAPPSTERVQTDSAPTQPGSEPTSATPTLLSAATALTPTTATTITTITAVTNQPLIMLLDSSVKIPGGCQTAWAAFLVMLCAGILGGLVYELTNLQGNVEVPHQYTADEVPTDPATGEASYVPAPYAIGAHMRDLGTVARLVIGGASALVSLLVINPPTAFQLVAAGIVAGYAGDSVFHLLKARLLATLWQNRANAQSAFFEQATNDAERTVQRLERDLEELRAELRLLTALLQQAPRRAEDDPQTGTFTSPDLDQATRIAQNVERNASNAQQESVALRARLANAQTLNRTWQRR